MAIAETEVEDLENSAVEPGAEVDETEVEQGTQTTGPEKSEEQEEHEGSVRIARFIAEKEKTKQLKAELEQQKRDNEALQQQAELAKMAFQQPEQAEEALVPPNPQDDKYLDDLDGTQWVKDFAEYNQKKDEQLAAITRQTLAEQQQQALQEAEQQRIEAERAAEFQVAQEAHYARADKLQAPNFVEVEDKFRNDVGDDLYQVVVETFDNSAELILALGNDQEKLVELLTGIQKSAPKGFKQLFEYAAQLGQISTGGDLPEPDEPLSGGVAAVAKGFDKELAELRAKKNRGEITQNQLLDAKKQLKEKYAA